MTQLTRHPAYLLIEDQIDVIAQKFRVMRLLRGAMDWLVAGICASVVAAFGAHYAGQGRLATGIFYCWIGFLVIGGMWWIVRPLLMRPDPVSIARIIESRIPGLHNGLTNSVLLAQADDLQDSPWLSPIFSEILASTQGRPLGGAVPVRDLSGAAMRLGATLIVFLIMLLIPSARAAFGHGWRQMLHPTAFVPKTGAVRVKKISPESITLLAGKPLEIAIVAEDPTGGQPRAKIIFENNALKSEAIIPQPGPDNDLQYFCRIERIDRPLRWRAEIAGTQTDWCQVKIIQQIEFEGIELAIKPPSYLRQGAQTIWIKPSEAGKPIDIVEGSRVVVTASVQQPVSAALLQIDQDPLSSMIASADGKRFSASFIVMRDMGFSVTLTVADERVACMPDSGLLKLNCTKDAPPGIEMRWPKQDCQAPIKAELRVSAAVKDDHGVTSARIRMRAREDGDLAVVHEQKFDPPVQSGDIAFAIPVPQGLRVHGQSIWVQVEATDNRELSELIGAGTGAPKSKDNTDPQTTATPVYRIEFQDAAEIARAQQQKIDKLRQLLQEMIKRQQDLLTATVAWKPAAKTMPQIHTGQVELRDLMKQTAETFPFEADDRVVQKTLLVLVQNPAADAIALAVGIQAEKIESEQLKLNLDLQARQRRIIQTLEALLNRANLAGPTTQPSKAGGDLDNDKEKLKELNEALKKFIAEEKRILDAEATLAKKPVDNFDDNDKKLAEELRMAQEKLDAFMQEKISDFSKLAEQDMANASLLKEMLEVFSEVTMKKDALKKQAEKLDIPAEEMGLELAKEISSNLEKWLMDTPDRQRWNQEDPIDKVDVPMAELPKELEDMVGELMEQQEDLFEEMEDTAANWADSLDKGAGWDAADGPIANMSAKGVTGNQLPNNNEMNGRSGEGRSGKSSGEMVEETASGKGGRMTPTRLDPTPFQQGQVKDEGKDPVGGATGGGKISGQGGAGLEGPVPPKDLREKMQRLANKQAELRNKAERLNLEQRAYRFDNFKLAQAVLQMRRVESDLKANRYQNVMRQKDVLLDKLDTSKMLLSGQMHAQRDTSPAMSQKLQDQINDADKGKYPPGWSEMLKEYYRKLSTQ